MQNLIQFLWRNNVTLLFLLLEALAFLLIVQNNSFHQSGFINATLNVTGTVNQWSKDVSEYVHLGKENERLANEIAQLRSADLSFYTAVHGESICMEDSILDQTYLFTAAKVINSTTHKKNNYLILDKGKKDGIEPEMGVICGQGVVGIVKEVTDNFSSVISILHQQTRVSATHINTGYFGSLVWPDGNYRSARLEDIPNHANVQLGDAIVTRGSSKVYPPGIAVGVVTDIQTPPGENFYEITVELSTDFKQIGHVYIAQYLLKDQQTQLEEPFKEEEDD